MRRLINTHNMKKIILIAALSFMYSCVHKENISKTSTTDTIICKNTIAPCLSDHVRRFAIVYENIDTTDIVVVEFDNKYPFPNYLKGVIDTLAYLSVKTKDNQLLHNGGYKGYTKAYGYYVEVYDSLNIGKSFYCEDMLENNVLQSAREKNSLEKGRLLLVTEDSSLYIWDVPLSAPWDYDNVSNGL